MILYCIITHSSITPEIPYLFFQNFAVCFHNPIFLKILPAKSAHPYWRYSSRYGIVSNYCRAFTCSNCKGSWQFCVSRWQTRTSPITLAIDHAHLFVMWYPLITDSTVNETTLDSMTRITASAYNRNINKRQARKFIWPCKPCYGLQISK